MNEQRNNGKGVFYGVIGVATLVVAIIGATFAYFTASASVNNVITGNMATVQLSLAVEKVVKVDETKKGMIPMSNGMVEQAINKTGNDVCVDDNGNAVCQIYKITITNSSTAGQFVDGYLSLRYGSGAPTDYSGYISTALFNNSTKAADSTTGIGTTMRWAQVFEAGDEYTTAGDQVLGTSDEKVTFTAIGAAAETGDDTPETKAAKAHNTANIRDSFTTYADSDGNKGVLSSLSIAGTSYNVIGTNYIRVSNHNWTADATGKQSYTRENDVTSALVFNHSIAAGSSADYYVVVWLSETGTNQTAGATVGEVTNPGALEFFDGNVTFISAQGSEVSATFSGYSRVDSQAAQAEENGE